VRKSRLHPSIRFWLHVQTGDGCWLWRGRKDKKGYGEITFDRRQQRAHRVAWFLVYGVWPSGVLCHKCDTPSCVRPDHLWDGTQRENVADCIAKGRFRTRRGEEHRSARLTWAIAREVRIRFADGVAIAVLAREYGVTNDTIAALVRGRTWREQLPDDLRHRIDERLADRVRRAIGKAKLSDDDTLAIRARRSMGESVDALAESFGVTKSGIWHVLRGETAKSTFYPVVVAKKRGFKLSGDDVDVIRALLRDGVRRIEIARRFNVSDSMIHMISNGRAWKEK
jgi:hypothetical protein